MSSVSNPKLAASWQANIRSSSGKRINIATKIPPTLRYRGLAEQIATFWDDLLKKSHSRDDLEKQAEMLTTSIETKLKSSAQPVARHFRKKTTALLEITFPKKHVSSFAEVSTEWLEERKLQVKSSSYRAYSNQIAEFTAFLGKKADLPLSEFDRTTLRKFQRRQAGQVSNKTANKKVKCVCAMLRWAYQQEIIDENHADRIKHLPIKNECKRRPFKLTEIQAILKFADPEWQSIIRAAYTTGQRLGDIAMMRWEDLDVEQKQWTFITRKTQKKNSIPLISDFWSCLDDVPECERTNFVHPKAAKLYQVNEGYSSATLSNQFANLLFKAGLREKKVSRRKSKSGRGNKRDLETLNFHCFRYTTATMLHENGASQAVAQQILGHDCGFVHQIYVKIRPEPIRAEIEKLSLFGAGNLTP